MQTALLLSRRLLADGIALSALVVQTAAYAAAPKQNNQVPGYYRYELGSFEVTAIYDGNADLDFQLIQGAPVDKIHGLLARGFADHGAVVPTSVNAYLVNTGEHMVLVDAGSGSGGSRSAGASEDRNVDCARHRLRYLVSGFQISHNRTYVFS